MCCIQQHPRQISSLRSLDLVHEVGYPWNWRDERIPARPLNYLNCFAKNSRTFRFGSSVGSIFSRCWNGSGVELLTTHYSKLLLLAADCFEMRMQKDILQLKRDCTCCSEQTDQAEKHSEKICSLQSNISHSCQKKLSCYFESLREEWVVGHVWGWIETL